MIHQISPVKCATKNSEEIQSYWIIKGVCTLNQLHVVDQKKDRGPRKRSPFRMDSFEKRHGSSVKMINDLVNDQTKIHDFDKASKQTKIELQKLQTRIAILESKQGEKELSELSNIPKVLDYFNLNLNCTKADINKTINLRLMEMSSESAVSKEIYGKSELNSEKRERLVIFLNQASSALLN